MREELKIRTSDVRKVLGIAPATMTDLAKKQNIKMSGGNGIKSKYIESSEVRRLLESRGVDYKNESQVIAFMICKGGTGKSSSTYYLSLRLASYGNNVLVIDADPQGNLSRAYNLKKDGHDLTKVRVLVDLIRKNARIEDLLIEVYPNLHLIPSNPRNSVLENAIRDNFKNPSLPLVNILKPLKKIYDYILIDCAPSLNLTNTAVVSASDMVILPVNPDDFSIMSLNQTLDEIEAIESDFKLKVDTKIVFSRLDQREFTSLKYLSQLHGEKQDMMMETVIRTSSDIKNAISKDEDLFSYSKSTAKEDYDNLAIEIMHLKEKLLPKKKLKKK